MVQVVVVVAGHAGSDVLHSMPFDRAGSSRVLSCLAETDDPGLMGLACVVCPDTGLMQALGDPILFMGHEGSDLLHCMPVNRAGQALSSAALPWPVTLGSWSQLAFHLQARQ